MLLLLVFKLHELYLNNCNCTPVPSLLCRMYSTYGLAGRQLNHYSSAFVSKSGAEKIYIQTVGLAQALPINALAHESFTHINTNILLSDEDMSVQDLPREPR